ncbi:hypothetical protein DBR32_11005 [Taibaiella sp. KBW10]|uniref:RagB/SusD family nutrient uptake outer membrane protein n=1 Tax=Taibaiella sp. KBW10 TaxID=2153357 RepID=UPI000F5ACD54|nr:RagB/SusD family nutrient uptake outer membrane protein [Taibaiella sp. KBW10]RQO30107.1 hypothetical protein DBR32_11005 [Taibaiella sp. KBW10]
MKIYKILSLVGLVGTVLTTTVSCKKDFLNNSPTSQIPTEEVFKTTQGARAAINGIHSIMFESTDHNAFGYPSIALMSDLMGGDMGMNRQGSGWFVTAYWYRDVNPQGTGNYMWGFYYDIINNANHIIQNIAGAKGTQADRDEIKAQALSYRAWAYFQLVNYYQLSYKSTSLAVAGTTRFAVIAPATPSTALGVPLYTEPTKIAKPRATLQEVYNQIIGDLDTALLLFTSSGNTRKDKTQIDIQVAKGIYARVALTMQNFTKAATMAREARGGYPLMSKTELTGGFNRIYTSEWIWGSVINAEQSGIYASFISQMDNTLNGSYASQQTRTMSVAFFDSTNAANDPNCIKRYAVDDYRRGWATKDSILRVGRWRPFYAQKKFVTQTANTFIADFPMMRASEMYLIEAEALAQQGSVPQANTVLAEFGVTRQPSYVATFATKNAVVQEVWRQRRLELWGEGFAFTDAKRNMATANTGVTPVGGVYYGFGRFIQIVEKTQVAPASADLIFKIPNSELNQNQGCIQNPL